MKAITKLLNSGKVVLAVACSFLPFLVVAADPPPPVARPAPNPGMRSNFRQRDSGPVLDPQQQQLFRQALQKYGEELTSLEGQLQTAMTELAKAALAEDYDEKVARTKAETIAKIQVSMMTRRSQALAAVVPTLRPEQRENLLLGPGAFILLAGGSIDSRERNIDPSGRGGGPMRGPQAPSDPVTESLFAPELVMRFQEQIALSDEQRQAIMSELQSAQQKFANLQPQLEKAKAALAALLKEERVELEPALAQADKLLDVERELRRVQLALQIGIKDRLTPEQQRKLQDLKNQRPTGNPMTAETPPAIQAKMQQVQAGIQQWQRDGRDPSPIGRAMRKFEPLMQAGQFQEAEAVLDDTLALLAAGKRPR